MIKYQLDESNFPSSFVSFSFFSLRRVTVQQPPCHQLNRSLNQRENWTLARRKKKKKKRERKKGRKKNESKRAKNEEEKKREKVMRGSMESRRFRHFWQRARSCRLRLSTACQITLKPRTCRACSLDVHTYTRDRGAYTTRSRNIIKPADGCERVGRMFPVIYARTSDILFRVITPPRRVWKVTSRGLCFAVPPSTVKWG